MISRSWSRPSGFQLKSAEARGPYCRTAPLLGRQRTFVHEAERCGKGGTDIQKFPLVVEVSSVSTDLSNRRSARHWCGVRFGGPAAGKLPDGRPVLAQPPPPVEREHSSRAADEFAIGDEHTEMRLIAELSLHAKHANTGVSACAWVVRRRATRRAVVHRETTHCPATQLAGEASTETGIDDAPREKQVDRRLEVARVLGEERSLLREEDLEALVHRHLRIVGLDLAEVRVDRRIDRQPVPDDHLGVHADPPVSLVAKGRPTGIEEASPRPNRVGVDLDVAPGRDPRKSTQRAELRDETLNTLGNVGPVHLFVVALNHTPDRDPPGLRLLVLEAQTPEGDRHADDVAVGRQPAFGGPHGIEAQVLLLAFGQYSIPLNSERIRCEDVRMLEVEERVEVDGHLIIGVDVLPARDRGTHLFPFILADEHDIQPRIVVAEIRNGRVAHRDAVARLSLAELRYLKGGVGRWISSQKILDPRCAIHTRNTEDCSGLLRANRSRPGDHESEQDRPTHDEPNGRAQQLRSPRGWTKEGLS